MDPLPPGPPASIRTLARFYRAPYGFFDDLARRHGDLFTVRFPSGPAVYVADPALIQEIWRKDQAGELTIRDRGFLGGRL